MPELSEIFNVPPKRRITIPENFVAVIMPREQAEELKSLCFLLRKGKRQSPEMRKDMHDIAGDLLLALVETLDEQ